MTTDPRRSEATVSHGRDIVVVGASAGGIQALRDLIGGLPADFSGAVLVVVHTSPHGPSALPRVLEWVGGLPAAHARHGEAIAGGRIYVAPPDYHLLVRPGHVELSHGPRENHSRPAVDPLFRSAARAYGPRVIGVVLSGALGDGAAGLMAIKARGGIAIVQDPAEAIVDGMPRSALQLVEVDRVLPAAEIAPALVRFAGEPGVDAVSDDERANQTIRDDIAEHTRDGRHDALTLYSCPDCGGSLWQIEEGPLVRFQCHVGHIFGAEALLGLKSEEVEAALWSCVRLLKEKATLTRQLATRTLSSGERDRGRRIEEQAQLDERHAAVIRELLESAVAPVSQAADVTLSLDEPVGDVHAS
jgi:two-component system chemotaxis response regulator CheB